MVTIEYKDPKNKRGIGTASTTPKRMTFTSPGVSSLIRMIINMDAAILTKTLAAPPHVLMLHEAVMGDPNTLEAANVILRNRRIDYPSIADQLDKIYHEGIDEWKKVIKATKDKYPKG